MSLAIDPDRVTRVLIGGVWHDVEGICVDSYEFVDPADDYCLADYGQGFRFRNERGHWTAGPLESIQAVEYLPAKEPA